MSNNKSIAVILGTAVGIAAVVTLVGVCASRHHTPVVNVNDIFDQARRTVQGLDKAVESLRRSAA